jgi:GT2 family glycosyltransferase
MWVVRVHAKAGRKQLILDDFGVVAIGRNEGERLIRCLKSVKMESRNIVYVDSGSTDSSLKVAQEIGAHVVALNLTKPFTAARARNEGFTALRAFWPNARFVQFIDGDCILVHGWLEKARKFMEKHSDVAIVCGRRRELHASASIYNQLCDLEWDTPLGKTIGCGGDSLVRVDAFEAVGGFRPQLIAGEEPELCVRLRERGWKIWRLDADMTQHDAAMTRLDQFWTRAVRGGHAFAEVSLLHRTSRYNIWGRETARAIFWGGLLPLTICLGALVNPAALWFALVYPFQICRVAFARGSGSPRSWIYALFLSLTKFAECQGILKFYWSQLSRQGATLIEYK